MALKKIAKITDRQMDTNGVVAAPTVLTGTPAENKAIFDRLVRRIIAPTMNDIIDNENEIVQNEDVRQEHEADRGTAEQARVEAEKDRVQAEMTRDQAEQAREQAEAQRQAVSAEVISQAQQIVDAGSADIEQKLMWAQEEADRAADRAEAAYSSMCSAEDACGWAEDAQAAAEQARDEAADFAQKSAQSAAVATQAIAPTEEAAAEAKAAAASATRSLAQTQEIASEASEQAGQARDYAEEAKEAAVASEVAAAHGPKVGENGNWFIWDAELGDYKDSGVYATGPVGPQGKDGPVGPPGTGSAYEAAVLAGYTGTEAEFNAALAAMVNAPFLSLSGGDIVGPIRIKPNPNSTTWYLEIEPGDVDQPNPQGTKGRFRINHSVEITEPVKAEAIEVDTGADIHGMLHTYPGFKAKFDGGIVIPENKEPGGLERVTLSVPAISSSRDDGIVHIEDKVKAGDIWGAFKPSSSDKSVGSSNERFNTVYSKKVDATEHVITPKIRPPAGAGKQYIRFITKDNAEPDESPDPLPVEWGGTGLGRQMLPEDIGAAPATHSHTPDEAGAAPASHSHAAGQVTAGTLPAEVKAATGTDYSTARLRNIYAGTGAMTAGSTALANGTIYLQYE